MELIDDYEVLSRDERGDITIKYTLTETPSEKWTRVYNRTINGINSMSILDTTSIIVKIPLATFYKNGIREKLQSKINKVDLEVFSDDQKIAIILEDSDSDGVLDNWMPGMIVLHTRGELLYERQSHSVVNDIVETICNPYNIVKTSEDPDTYVCDPNIFKLDINPDEYSDYKFYIRSIAESLNLSSY